MHVCSWAHNDHLYVCLAGALLAVGITNCGVQDECDPAYALLCESVNHADDSIRIGAIMGLGLAYAGTQKAEVQVSLQSYLIKLLARSLTHACMHAYTHLCPGLACCGYCFGICSHGRQEQAIKANFKLCILLQPIAGCC